MASAEFDTENCISEITSNNELSRGTSVSNLRSKRIRLLQHAIKYNDREFIGLLPRLLLHAPPSEVVDIMPDQMYKVWVGISIICFLLFISGSF